MPELPRLLPQASVQPGAQSPGVGMRNDVGAGHIASGLDTLENLFIALEGQETQTKAIQKASDDHVEYLARQSDLQNKIRDPKEFQNASAELAKEYLSGRDKALLEGFGGSQKALRIYKEHFNPKVEAGFGESIKQATGRRMAQATPELTATADTMVRDVLAVGPEGIGWDAGVQEINSLFDKANPVLIPNKEVLRQKALDELHFGVAIRQARANPVETLKKLSKDSGYVVDIGSGKGQDVIRMDPTMRENLTKIAYDELAKQQHQVTLAREEDTRLYDARRKRVDFNLSRAIMQGEDEALSAVAGLGLDERGRPAIDASDLRAAYTFKATVDKARIEGAITTPADYGIALNRMKRGDLLDSVEIMSLKNVSFDDKKILVSGAKELENKLLDRDYASYHEQKKDGDNFIRTMTKSANPFAGFAKPDLTTETFIARYHAQLEQQESALRLIPNAKMTSIAPMDVAVKFMQEQEKHMAVQFKHDAKRMIGQLQPFVPPDRPISYENLNRGIDQSNLPKTEKLILQAIAYQMEKQGVTTDVIHTQIRGAITKEAGPRSEQGFYDWVQGLTEKARQQYEESKKWWKGDNVGE